MDDTDKLYKSTKRLFIIAFSLYVLDAALIIGGFILCFF